MARQDLNLAIRNVSIADLQAEIARRQSNQGALIKERDQLLRRLAEIEGELNGLGALKRPVGRPRKASNGATSATPKRRGRQPREGSLPSVLAGVLAGKTMSIDEAVVAVREAGYQSSAANLKSMVNQALSNRKLFKRVSRGMYTAA